MANTIVCNKCGNIIEISEALKDQLRGEEREKIIAEVEAKAIKKAEADLAQTVKKARDDAADAEAQNLKLLRQLEAGEDEKRKMKRLLEETELNAKKKLLEDEDKIRQEALNKAFEEHKLKDAEKDKVINDLKNSLEDAQRKATQGSQQLQGEILELDLERTLKEAFPGDVVTPVAKGVLGADISQTVRSPKGMDCGTILWESKRTKAWSAGWITKLKEDLLSAKADLSAVISEALPDEAAGGLGHINEVWIASPKLFIPLAALLRKSLLDAAKQKVISQNRQSKSEFLYNYVTSPDFVNTLKSLLETYQEMQLQIARERGVYEKYWSQREMQVKKLFAGVANIYGGMQEIAGAALPGIPILELESGSDN
jgi:hypothetical protein